MRITLPIIQNDSLNIKVLEDQIKLHYSIWESRKIYCLNRKIEERKAGGVMNWNEAIKDLDNRRAKALLGGGQNRIDKQHAIGKMTACCNRVW